VRAVKYAGIALTILILASAAAPQTTEQSYLIVRQWDGHAMLNLFLFGPGGLIITAAAKYSTVDSFNLPTANPAIAAVSLPPSARKRCTWW